MEFDCWGVGVGVGELTRYAEGVMQRDAYKAEQPHSAPFSANSFSPKRNIFPHSQHPAQSSIKTKILTLKGKPSPGTRDCGYWFPSVSPQ